MRRESTRAESSTGLAEAASKVHTEHGEESEGLWQGTHHADQLQLATSFLDFLNHLREVWQQSGQMTAGWRTRGHFSARLSAWIKKVYYRRGRKGNDSY